MAPDGAADGAFISLGDAGAAQSDAASALGNTSYGFIAAEPIVEDGSDAGLGIAANLVERMDELSAALPLLQEARVSLVMIVQAIKLQTPAAMEQVFSLVEDAARRGLEVRPVPVLNGDDGYYPNATNIAAFAPLVRNLVAQWKARGLVPTTMVIDMEPPKELTTALASGDLTRAAPAEHVDRSRYAAAVTGYAALADELHRAGWKIAVTTQAQLLADYDDGDDDLRQYFNVVLDGVPWDQLDFQLYRSAYEGLADGLDSYFVYYAAQRAAAQYPGIKVGLGLGLTHPGPVFPDTPTEGSQALRADLEAAVSAGVPRELITVYNLKGVLLGPPVCQSVLGCSATEYVYLPNDPHRWFIDASGAQAPAVNSSTAKLWSQFDFMDSVLDP
ncbi:MAG: hypothetical protein JWN04_4897 [Myxococcaceae bacterium]|nr:hypothetical protein [Myxococcaceae bacterium]